MPERLWNKSPRSRRYRSRRKADISPWASKIVTKSLIALLLVVLVWFGAYIPAVKEYMRLCLVPGASAQSPWGEWLDWQPTGETVQPVWQALTGRQDRLSFVLPVDGEVVQPFGWTSGGETGEPRYLDYIVIRGEPSAQVKAVLAGKVVQVDHSTSTSSLTIDHGSQMQTTYSNCEAVLVRVGDKVKADDLIARTGGSGELHFKVLTGGRPTDPLLRVLPGVR